MKWSYWIELYIRTYCVARGLRPLTIAAYEKTLQQFRDWVRIKQHDNEPDQITTRDCSPMSTTCAKCGTTATPLSIARLSSCGASLPRWWPWVSWITTTIRSLPSRPSRPFLASSRSRFLPNKRRDYYRSQSVIPSSAFAIAPCSLCFMALAFVPPSVPRCATPTSISSS